MELTTYHCPKCSAQLEASGVAAVSDGNDYVVFQCDTCTHKVQAFGGEFEVAFTFAVRSDGSWFVPAAE